MEEEVEDGHGLGVADQPTRHGLGHYATVTVQEEVVVGSTTRGPVHFDSSRWTSHAPWPTCQPCPCLQGSSVIPVWERRIAPPGHDRPLASARMPVHANSRADIGCILHMSVHRVLLLRLLRDEQT